MAYLSYMLTFNLKVFQLYFYVARLLTPAVRVTARIPMAQSVLESGDSWISSLAVNANNIFGMKMPKARNTTAKTATLSGFAVFVSKYDAIRDYVLWLEAMGLTTDAALMDHIRAGKYTPDAHYQTRLQRVLAEQSSSLVSPMQFAAAGTAAAVAAVVGIKLVNKIV